MYFFTVSFFSLDPNVCQTRQRSFYGYLFDVDFISLFVCCLEVHCVVYFPSFTPKDTQQELYLLSFQFFYLCLYFCTVGLLSFIFFQVCDKLLASKFIVSGGYSTFLIVWFWCDPGGKKMRDYHSHRGIFKNAP